jgi:hypothetical protein
MRAFLLFHCFTVKHRGDSAMATQSKIDAAKRDAADSVTAWLLTLEAARARGDEARVKQALEQLRRKGVTLRFNEPNHEAINA